MPFNTLLLSCLKPGTSVTQNGVSVSIRPQGGETILFFEMDCDRVRQNLDIESSAPICDYLVFYHLAGTKPQNDKIILCLLELKGRDTEHAIEQLISTYTRLKKRLNELPGTGCQATVRQITWAAFVCSNPNSPISQIKPYAKEIERCFSNRFTMTHQRDKLGEFLRS